MTKKWTWTKWTPEQESLIEEQYAEVGPKVLAARLGVSEDRIRRKAKQLGVAPLDHKWSEEEDQILQERYQTDGLDKLATELGLTSQAVYARARRLGVWRSSRKTPPKGFEWTEEMLTAVKERYVDEGGHALAAKFGVAVDTVRRKAASLGLHTIAGYKRWGRQRAEQNTSVDIHYFDQWSPNMAYVLGFLFADGNVDKAGHAVTINVKVDDIAVLNFVKDQTKAKYEITVGEPRGNDRPVASLVLCSTVLCESLAKRGLLPRKTYNDDPFPEVPDDMLMHFVRGYFDGDGGVCTHLAYGKYDTCEVGFTGSPKFISEIKDVLVQRVGMREMSVRFIHGKTAVYAVVNWSACKGSSFPVLADLHKFFEFVYPPGFGFCYERKYRKLADWLGLKPEPCRGDV